MSSYCPTPEVEENYELLHAEGTSWVDLAAGAERAGVSDLAEWLRAKAPAKVTPKDRQVPSKQTAARR